MNLKLLLKNKNICSTAFAQNFKDFVFYKQITCPNLNKYPLLGKGTGLD